MFVGDTRNKMNPPIIKVNNINKNVLEKLCNS